MIYYDSQGTKEEKTRAKSRRNKGKAVLSVFQQMLSAECGSCGDWREFLKFN